jgi:hypothetical protein
LNASVSNINPKSYYFIWSEEFYLRGFMGVYKYLDLKLEDGSKLRVRFMFDPTDDEIVDYYLNEEGLLSISSIS